MSITRRAFLGCGVSTALVAAARHGAADDQRRPSMRQLERAAAAPVLKTESFKSPVVIESMELLRNGRTFLVRIRSKDGAEGISVANAHRLIDAYPIFLNRLVPFFTGKDARRWEELLWEFYRDRSNYKLQGLALWVCQAAAELAVLDLLGKTSNQSIGELLGGVRRREISVYRASGRRGNTPEAEVAYLRELISETGAQAVKFRLGGRMSRNADSLLGRSEQLIRLAREELGEKITLYADANSSYDAQTAIRIGRLMEKYDYGFFEEPCRFDHLEETKVVADALTIPIAGGEQEFSEWRFRQMIHHRMVDIVQPDLHYYGGLIRSMRVARMAEVAGMLCTPHMSGSGLGFLDVAHFVSCLPNPGPHHEFKGHADLPVHCETSSLKCEQGSVRVPSGPGYGVTIDPGFVRAAKRVTTLS